MPTNEERREAVKALHDLCDGCETVSDYDLAKALCLVAVSRNAYSSDSVLRIADLIEPESERTCTITHAVFNEGDPTMEYEAWNCSHCGELPYADADSFSYCPCCGAKVVYE